MKCNLYHTSPCPLERGTCSSGSWSWFFPQPPSFPWQDRRSLSTNKGRRILKGKLLTESISKGLLPLSRGQGDVRNRQKYRYDLVVEIRNCTTIDRSIFPVLNRLVNFHFHLVAAGGDTKRRQNGSVISITCSTSLRLTVQTTDGPLNYPALKYPEIKH